MKIGIFGGTFDPPHIGHVNMCRLFLEKLSLDRLYVIPAHIPPHKLITSRSTADDRFEMAKIAFSNLSQKVTVSDIELKRDGKSYTAYTLKQFREQGFDDLYFLCGTDMFLTLDTWYNPSYIFESATIACVRRESENEISVLIKEKTEQYKENFNARIVLIDADAIEISSSEVREAIKNDNPLSSCYISPEIKNYIEAKGLYRN